MTIHIDPQTAGFVLTTSDDFQRSSNPVLQSMYMRLAIRRGTAFWDPNLGSDLPTLTSEHVVGDVEREVEDRARVALQPMLDAGELLELELAAERVATNRVDLVIRATDAALRPLEFTHFVRVG